MFRVRAVLLLFAAYSTAMAGSNAPAAFSQVRAMAHVRSLAALKRRTAGTSGEAKAIRYVKAQLRRAGLDLTAEPFQFRSFELQRADLRIGALSVAPVRIVFDPYRGNMTINAEATFVTPSMANTQNGLAGVDLSRRIVVTTADSQLSRIANAQPAAVAIVSGADLEKLKGTAAGTARLVIEGRVTTLTSANLVAAAPDRNAGREVILSAHIDSAGTPGAQDNASGVAVLLELARTLPKLDLPFRLQFVFFGAEELGRFGSKAYLDRHREDLERCGLVFNLDSVGGHEIWIDMRGGVRNVPRSNQASRQAQEHLLEAGTDFRGRWLLLRPEPPWSDTSNVPPWLQTAILDSVRELGYSINEGQNASSDHRTFFDAGIVATDIAIGGIKSHTPDDVPGQIDPLSLEKAARIVTGVVSRVR